MSQPTGTTVPPTPTESLLTHMPAGASKSPAISWSLGNQAGSQRISPREPHSFDTISQGLGIVNEFPEFEAIYAAVRARLEARKKQHVLVDENGGSVPSIAWSQAYHEPPSQAQSSGYPFAHQIHIPTPTITHSPSIPSEPSSALPGAPSTRRFSNGVDHPAGAGSNGWLDQFSLSTMSHNSISNSNDSISITPPELPSPGRQPQPTASLRQSPFLRAASVVSNDDLGSHSPSASWRGLRSRTYTPPPLTFVTQPGSSSTPISQYEGRDYITGNPSQELLAGIPEEDNMEAFGFEEKPIEPSMFFHTVLRTCLAGLSTVQSQTPAVKESLLACKLALDCIRVLDDGMADMIATMIPTKSFSSGASAVSNGTSTAKKAPKKKKTQALLSMQPARRSLATGLPAEILLKVFSSFADVSPAAGPAADSPTSSPFSPSAQLCACSLVCKSWSNPASMEMWKRITMEDDAPRLGRFLLSLASSSTSLQGHRRGNLIRVVSIACTESELSLLLTAAPYLVGLHSLELRRSMIPGAPSYRLLPKIANKFPNVRSLLADLVPPDTLMSVVKVAQSLTDLAHLHVSLGPSSGQPPPPMAPDTVYDPYCITSLFPYATHLVTLSLWRVPLPRDEGLWAPSLAMSCPSLSAIRIDDCGPDLSMDVFIGVWRRCLSLETIVMRRVKRRAVFTDLVERPRMRRVVLDGCWISDTLCEEMARCAPELLSFYVEDDWMDEDFRAEGARTIVNDLTDDGVLALAKYLKKLRTITFIGFPGRRQFQASSLAALLQANPDCFALNLARMDPAWPYKISDEWLLDLAPALKNIEILEMYIQNAVSETALMQALAIAAASANSVKIEAGQVLEPTGGRIRRLGLSGCSQLGDVSLGWLPVLCPGLERLDMAGWGRARTLEGIQGFVDRALSLRECVVNLPRANGIDDMEDDGGRRYINWGKVVMYEDPASEEVFSPYSVWESEVRRLSRRSGVIV